MQKIQVYLDRFENQDCFENFFVGTCSGTLLLRIREDLVGSDISVILVRDIFSMFSVCF